MSPNHLTLKQMDWNERAIIRVSKGLIYGTFAIFVLQHMWSEEREGLLASVTSIMAYILIPKFIFFMQRVSINRRTSMDHVAVCILLAPVIVSVAFLGVSCLTCGLLFLYFSKHFLGTLFFWTGLFFLTVSLQLLALELRSMSSSTSPPGLYLTEEMDS